MFDIALSTVIKYVVIAVSTTGLATYIVHKCGLSRFGGNRRRTRQSEGNAFSEVFSRHTSTMCRQPIPTIGTHIQDIPSSQPTSSEPTSANRESLGTVAIDTSIDATVAEAANTRDATKEPHSDSERTNEESRPIDCLTELVCSAFNSIPQDDQVKDLSEYLHERRLDFDISKEDGNIVSLGLFLVDFCDEMQRKLQFVGEKERTVLVSLSDKMRRAMVDVGFEFINLAHWDRSVQKILSVERRPNVDGLQVVSTEETGLIYKGQLIRKQGVSIVTNEREV